MNPYTSSGSVATMTANVSGNDSLNDLGDGPRSPATPERYPRGRGNSPPAGLRPPASHFVYGVVL